LEGRNRVLEFYSFLFGLINVVHHFREFCVYDWHHMIDSGLCRESSFVLGRGCGCCLDREPHPYQQAPEMETKPFGGDETRPRNCAVVFVMRVK
jgi:hypothetical protein